MRANLVYKCKIFETQNKASRFKHHLKEVIFSIYTFIAKVESQAKGHSSLHFNMIDNTLVQVAYLGFLLQCSIMNKQPNIFPLEVSNIP